ncbi:MAG: subtilisin family serine protease [Bacteriovoracaceae bacterium]|jgi:hypothetical protein
MKILFLFLFSNSVFGSTLGLLDSGADPNQVILKKHLRINKAELRGIKLKDDDKNGYIDDIKGWNFIEETPDPFDTKLYGEFESLFYKYYKVREKKALETWTSEEENWYKELRKDEDFLEKLKKFRSYIHGSHVAGIAMRRDHKKYGPLNFINVKYLGKAEAGRAKEPDYSPLKKGSFNNRLNHLKKFITKYNTWQEGKLERAISYVCQRAHVVNGSWGKSFKSSVKVVSNWYKEEFDTDPDESIAEELADLFLSNLVTRTEKITRRYPNILFVFSAGNTKTDNDLYSHYPSNARGPNILAVGAARDNERTSSSNYGLKTVDLFAPGFLIESQTPEGKTLRTTGTSQAAPAVSHAALVIRNINPSLTPKNIKAIIMKTVDLHPELISQSGGLLNLKRAIFAAKASKSSSLEKAISLSLKKVGALSFPKGSKPLNTMDDSLPEAF